MKCRTFYKTHLVPHKSKQRLLSLPSKSSSYILLVISLKVTSLLICYHILVLLMFELPINVKCKTHLASLTECYLWDFIHVVASSGHSFLLLYINTILQIFRNLLTYWTVGDIWVIGTFTLGFLRMVLLQTFLFLCFWCKNT